MNQINQTKTNVTTNPIITTQTKAILAKQNQGNQNTPNTPTNHQTRNGKALCLINTKDIHYEDWLNARKQGIGSSDAASAIGLNPYQSPLALWLVKTGRDELLKKPDPTDDTQPVYWGSLLEPIVAAQYSKRTGHRVRKVNAILQHADYPWMLANIDREIIGVPDVKILECKTAGINGARLWKEGIPEYIQVQVMHQLAVTGQEAADVAVLIGGQELQIHRIHRDETVISQLIELEQQFWHYVQTDIAPPADGSDSAAEALRCLFPKDNTEVIDLSNDADLNLVFEELQQVRQQQKEITATEAQLRQRIEQTMGVASIAQFRNGQVTWKKSKDSTTFNTKGFKEAYPYLVEQFSIPKPGSRRFLIQSY